MRTRFLTVFLTVLTLTISWNVQSEEFLMGATTHFEQGKGELPANLEVFRACGLTSPRDDTPWRRWNPAQGSYSMSSFYSEYLEYALSLGLTPLQVLAYSNVAITPGYPKTPESAGEFAKFAAHLAARYKGRCRLWQIWNEWDGGCGMPREVRGTGDAKSYAALLAMVYPKMKQADPACVVIANSATSENFLEDMFKAGILNNCDGYSFHGYVYGRFGKERTAEGYIARIRNVAALAKKYNNGISKPLYLTEVGWPNNLSRNGSDESLSADYAARIFLLAKTIPEVKGLWWYDFQDDGCNSEDPEDNFGLVTTDLTPKEPFYAIRSVAPVVQQGRFLRQLESPDASTMLLLYRMPDNTETVALWTTQPECRKEVIFERGSAPEAPIRLEVAGHVNPEKRAWGFREWFDAESNTGQAAAKLAPDRFSVTVTGRPVLLSGKLDGIRVAAVKTVKRPAPKRRDTLPVPAKIIFAPRYRPNFPLPEQVAGDAVYRRLTDAAPGGDKDLSAAFGITHDCKMLYLTIAVEDDVHDQKHCGKSLWRGDSIQLGFVSFSPYKPVPGIGSCYQLGLTRNGAELIRESSQLNAQSPTQMKCRIRRIGTETRYEVTLPLTELGITDFTPGMPLGFSMVINDSDGSGRKGYLHWGDGIAAGKKTEEYNWVVLQ